MEHHDEPSKLDPEIRLKELYTQLNSFFGDIGLGTEPTLSHRILELIGSPPPLGLSAIRHTLSKESDRGCALLAGAFLDDQLAELLRASFLDDLQASAALLDEDRALGTFSSRINACRCMGLLPIDTVRALHLIRKIRNDFAHEVDVSFETPSVISRCNELFEDPVRKPPKPRSRFITNVFMILADVHITRQRAVRPTPPRALSERLAESASSVAKVSKLVEELLDEIDPTKDPSPHIAPDGLTDR